MLCLFRNARLSPMFHILASLISWGTVFYWLYFSFIHKSFLENVFAGKALMVDLLLGLPVVLVFAIVIYAFLYWSIKLLVILLFPHTIIHLKTDLDEESDNLLDAADLEQTKKTDDISHKV